MYRPLFYHVSRNILSNHLFFHTYCSLSLSLSLSSNSAALDSVSFTVRDSASQVSANTASIAIWVQVMDYGGAMEVPMPHATQPVNISLWGYSLGINYATFGVGLPNDERDRVTVTLSCNACALSFGNNNSGLVSHLAAQPTGVTTVAQGNNQLVFSGNVADCNNAISGIVYTRMAFYSGPDVINVTIYSGGHFYYAGTAVTVAKLPLSLSINAIPIASSFVPAMIPASSTLGAFLLFSRVRLFAVASFLISRLLRSSFAYLAPQITSTSTATTLARSRSRSCGASSARRPRRRGSRCGRPRSPSSPPAPF